MGNILPPTSWSCGLPPSPVCLPWEENPNSMSFPYLYGRGVLWHRTKTPPASPSLPSCQSNSPQNSDSSDYSSSYNELAAICNGQYLLRSPVRFVTTEQDSIPCSLYCRTPTDDEVSVCSSTHSSASSARSPKMVKLSNPIQETRETKSDRNLSGKLHDPAAISPRRKKLSRVRIRSSALFKEQGSPTRKDKLIRTALSQSHNFSKQLEKQIRQMKTTRGRRTVAEPDVSLLKLRRSPRSFFADSNSGNTNLPVAKLTSMTSNQSTSTAKILNIWGGLSKTEQSVFISCKSPVLSKPHAPVPDGDTAFPTEFTPKPVSDESFRKLPTFTFPQLLSSFLPKVLLVLFYT